jgi:hypothetical protein
LDKIVLAIIVTCSIGIIVIIALPDKAFEI